MPIVMRKSPQESIPGGQIGGRPRRRGGLGSIYFRSQCRTQAGGDFILHREQVVDVPVISSGPQLLTLFGGYQLGCDAYLGAGAPHRTLDQIGCVNFPRDETRTEVFSLERERRVSAQDPKKSLQ